MSVAFQPKIFLRSYFTFFFIIFYFYTIAQTICAFQESKPIVQELLIGNKISWTTTQEHDCQVFKVEKSSEGNAFFEIGLVQANGKHGQLYTFLDTRIGYSHCFYRLTVYGKNGYVLQSEVLDFQRIMPNDMLITATSGITSDRVFSVTLQSAVEGNLEYVLACTENGAAQTGQFRLARGINLLHLDLESLPYGLYELRLTLEYETEIVQVKKVKKSEISTLLPMVEKK
jgi:hypothetical protein